MLAEDVPSVAHERVRPEATVETRRLLETASLQEQDHVLNAAVTRFERRLSDECSCLRFDMTAVRQEIAKQGALLRQEFSDQRFELLKWAFAFWVGQTLATILLIGVVLAR